MDPCLLAPPKPTPSNRRVARTSVSTKRGPRSHLGSLKWDPCHHSAVFVVIADMGRRSKWGRRKFLPELRYIRLLIGYHSLGSLGTCCGPDHRHTARNPLQDLDQDITARLDCKDIDITGSGHRYWNDVYGTLAIYSRTLIQACHWAVDPHSYNEYILITACLVR